MPYYSPVDVKVVAKTGWTTEELKSGISEAGLDPAMPGEPFDLVTLLVGVNNQYRNRSCVEYARDFEELLKMALAFAGGRAKHVVVLSIPDWGVTPFAKDRNVVEIAKQIDEFNAANYEISKRKYKVSYVNVTPWTREAAADASLLAADGLHPSAREYARWAEAVFAKVDRIHRKTRAVGPSEQRICGVLPVDSVIVDALRGLGLV
jgi:hypothetical protein